MTARPEHAPPAPYVGLRPFEFHEAALFYGRGEHIAEMMRTLREWHFLAVVGSSGSGKSSLVRAGLLPAIVAGFMKGGEEAADWRVVIMRPGLDPYENLLRELLPTLAPGQSLDPKLVEFRRETLRGGPRGLVEVVADSLLPEPARLIVLVDQFEEIFRFLGRAGLSQPDDGSSLSDRRNAALAFVDMLLTTTAERDPHVYVVLTMRSEYLGECEAFLGLSAAISRSQFLTPRMTREQIQDIIERPIAAAGGRIEPQVVTDLLNSLGTDQDQLPRVEHVLLRMWSGARETRGNQPVALTVDDYREAGRFESALDEHAEQLYRELGLGIEPDRPSEKHRVAEQLFRSLAAHSSQGTLVRRLSSVAEVASIARASEQIVAEVVEHFRQPGCNFVVATPSAPLTGKTTLDISHEALLRQWTRLRTWLEEEAQSAQIYRRLAETADLHAAGKASLWRGPDLQQALDWRDRCQPSETWAARYHPRFESAMHFLEASVALREGEKQGLNADMMQRLELFGYEIEERTGEGGFGIVYRARRVAEGRTVALKMRAGGAELSVANRELFVRWAEEIGPSNHEEIVSVLEVHQEANPLVLVMEWVDGLPINVALKDADWNAKASAVAVVCDSIDHVHQRGGVHGRLKPNNLLVGLDGKPKVLDCGLSRFLADGDDTRYLAPEQIEGRTTVGPATDIYALGVILYELLTGKPPFAADGFHVVPDAQLHDAPELPMLKRAAVPEPLQRICLKALEKKQEDRYHSMREMREDLERYRRRELVVVRPSYYNNLIESPARGHVAEIDRWHEQALITDSEHVRLRRAYQGLTRSGLEAISESRLVHWRVLLLYLGGWLLLAGAASWLALYYTENPKLSETDVKNVRSLATKLEQGKDEVSSFLKSKLSDDTKTSLKVYSALQSPESSESSESPQSSESAEPPQSSEPPESPEPPEPPESPDPDENQQTPTEPPALKGQLVEDFNKRIEGETIYDDKRFEGVSLRPETQKRIARYLQAQKAKKISPSRLNRKLLEDAYPEEIARQDLGLIDRGLAEWPWGRILIGLIPTLLTNGLWWFFYRRGSYRYAFTAMILGLLSLPFSVAVTVHEIADIYAIHILNTPLSVKDDLTDQIFDGTGLCLPNTQLFIALLVAVVWGTYVARQSRTFTSTTIVGIHFLALYLIGLDFWGLKYFFEEKISDGGLYTLPAAVALVAAGRYVGQKRKRPGQAVPLFAMGMVVTILASQAIATWGPKDWGWTTHENVWVGAIEVALGLAYFAFSRYLRDRFRVEAAAAYRVLAWLAPVAFLGGLALMDYSWRHDNMWTFAFLGTGKELTPWAPVLLASSIIVVLLAARVQSYFYVSCGLIFLAYILDRIAFETPAGWPWPFTILCIGLVVVGVMRWRDSRDRVGEDIDDVGELLIRRSRAASSAATEKVDALKR